MSSRFARQLIVALQDAVRTKIVWGGACESLAGYLVYIVLVQF